MALPERAVHAVGMGERDHGPAGAGAVVSRLHRWVTARRAERRAVGQYRVGQLLLGQPGIVAQLPQQPRVFRRAGYSDWLLRLLPVVGLALGQLIQVTIILVVDGCEPGA